MLPQMIFAIESTCFHALLFACAVIVCLQMGITGIGLVAKDALALSRRRTYDNVSEWSAYPLLKREME